MSERELMNRGIAPSDAGADPREERLRALYTGAYEPVSPSESLRARVETISAGAVPITPRRTGPWQRQPVSWPAMGAAGAAVLAIGMSFSPAWLHRGRTLGRPPEMICDGAPIHGNLTKRPPSATHREERAPQLVATTDVPPAKGKDGATPDVPARVGKSARQANRVSLPLSPRRSFSTASAADLAYLNGDPGIGFPRWTQRPAGGREQTEAGIRRQTPVKDDFVTIPFPRLVSTSDRQIAAAEESYQREVAIVDSRLAHEVTCAFKATALSDLCEKLKADTGIDLRAGNSVADEKVTVFCEKLPLRDVMRQLARPFGYTWLRSGKTGDYRYELAQDLKSQLLEEELRNRDQNQAIVALDREMSQFRPYLGLTPEQARARARTAGPGEKELLEKLAGPGWAGIQMYFQLSPRDLAALRAGERLRYSSAPRNGEQLLPAEVASGIPQEFVPRPDAERAGGKPGEPGGAGVGHIELGGVFTGTREGEFALQAAPGSALKETPPEPHTEAQLWIEQSELGQITLSGSTGRMTAGPDGVQRWISRDDLAVGQSPAIVKPQNAAANSALKSDPALQKRLALSPAAGEGMRKTTTVNAGEPGTARTGPNSAPKVTTADVLEKLHKATGLPIVADYYTRLYRPEAVTVKDMPLFDALNQLCDTMRLHWTRETSGATAWLQFRSASFFHDRLKEVPNRLLARWATSRKEHGSLSLDELIEIAQLPDAQLDATEMAEGAQQIWGLAEWGLARGHGMRPHLRFLATASPAQRQAATGPDGLAFTKMTLAQQQQFIALLSSGPGGRPPGGPAPTLEELAGTALRVDYAQAGSYEWRRPQGDQPAVSVREARGGRPSLPPPAMFEPAPVRERTREAALQAARRVDPGATEAQITTPTQPGLLVQIMTSGPEGRMPMMTLHAGGGGVNVGANRVRLRPEDGGVPPPP